MAAASLRVHTDAVKTKLAASGVLVGDAVKPAGGGFAGKPGESLFTPYMVLYPAFGTFDGTIAAPSDDADIEYQVTCVGETREQAEWVGDKAITALVDQTVTVTGRFTMRARLVETGAVRRDDEPSPSLFYTTPRFALYTTPA